MQDEYTATGVVSLSGDLTVGTEDGIFTAGGSLANKMTITSDGVMNINTKATADIDYLTNDHGANGIIINSGTSGFTGSLITSSSVAGTFKQIITDTRWWLVTPPFTDLDSYDFHDGTNDAFMRPYNSPGEGWGDYYGSPAVDLNIMEGYEYWPTTTFEFDQSGTFITGDKTLLVSKGGTGTYADWNLVGNPYPCGLDWAEVADKVNCDGSSFYLYTGGGYVAHNGTIGTGSGDVGDGRSGIISPFQGFFLKRAATGGSDDVDIENADKVSSETGLQKSDKSDFSNLFKVSALYGENESLCVIYQQDDATNGADDIYDAEILFNNDPEFMEIYSLAGDSITTLQHDVAQENGREYWNLLNDDGFSVSYGVYIAHIEAPGVGEKIIKFALIK